MLHYNAMTACKKCGKPLVSIGKARKNGVNHKDWESRELHKACWMREGEDMRMPLCKGKFNIDEFLINLENKIINNIST